MHQHQEPGLICIPPSILEMSVDPFVSFWVNSYPLTLSPSGYLFLPTRSVVWFLDTAGQTCLIMGWLHAGGSHDQITGWLGARLHTSEPMWGFDWQLHFLYREMDLIHMLR